MDLRQVMTDSQSPQPLQPTDGPLHHLSHFPAWFKTAALSDDNAHLTALAMGPVLRRRGWYRSVAGEGMVAEHRQPVRVGHWPVNNSAPRPTRLAAHSGEVQDQRQQLVMAADVRPGDPHAKRYARRWRN
jgi:hypothetical protein